MVITATTPGPCGCCQTGCALTVGADLLADFPSFTDFPNLSSAQAAISAFTSTPRTGPGTWSCLAFINSQFSLTTPVAASWSLSPGTNIFTANDIEGPSQAVSADPAFQFYLPFSTTGSTVVNSEIGINFASGGTTVDVELELINSSGVVVDSVAISTSGSFTIFPILFIPADDEYLMVVTVSVGVGPAIVPRFFQISTINGVVTTCGIQAAYNSGTENAITPCI